MNATRWTIQKYSGDFKLSKESMTSEQTELYIFKNYKEGTDYFDDDEDYSNYYDATEAFENAKQKCEIVTYPLHELMRINWITLCSYDEADEYIDELFIYAPEFNKDLD